MASPTNCYCDYAAGNDYKGATFTDGAYTQATKTLTKAGAFAASQVNHWLKISGTHITTGYYKVADITGAPNAVILATDASSDGSDSTDVACTQHDGTTTKPWRSIQGALDLITRDATNGNQINVKAGTAQVNQAALAITIYGTPAEAAPLVLRGYTTAAGDGGIGEIDCNGAAMWAASQSYVMLIDLEMHNFGNNAGVVLNGAICQVHHCEIHKGTSSPTSKALLTLRYDGRVTGSYIHDAGTAGQGINGGQIAWGNYIYNCLTGITSCPIVINNIFHNCTTIAIQEFSDAYVVLNNSIYSSSAATGAAISNASTNYNWVQIMNNIIEGYSGTGGKAIYSLGDIAVLGYNAFYNNATNNSVADVLVNLTAFDVSLASSPFTNAAGGDFSLATGVAGAIDGAFPGAWYGPAGTTDHADIGAVQNGAGASTGAAVRIVPCGKVGL